jgi:hypothetical protein
MRALSADDVVRNHLRCVSIPGIRKAYFSGFLNDTRGWKKIGVLIAELDDGEKVKTEIVMDLLDLSVGMTQQAAFDNMCAAVDKARESLVAQSRKKLAAPVAQISQ